MNCKQHTKLSLLFVLLFSFPAVHAMNIDKALEYYSDSGTLTFNAQTGEALWNKKFTAEDGSSRSCTTCHGENLHKSGKHKKTGKKIEPMALSVNAERYTKMKKIKKWFKRNCKWTVGRECTMQEKGDVLKYLSQLK